MSNLNPKGPLRLPRPNKSEIEDTDAFALYMDSMLRAIEQSISNVYRNNNTSFIISPNTTAARSTVSIAGDTTDPLKLRDLTLTLLNVLKSSQRVN